MRVLFYLSLIYLSLTPVLGQDSDLYGVEKSSKYANYLFKKGDYKQAVIEYKRLVFLDSADQEFKIKLLQSHYRGATYKAGLLQARTFYSSDSLFPSPVGREFVYLLLNTEYRYRTSAFLRANHKFNKTDHLFYSSANLLLDYEFDSVKVLMTKNDRIVRQSENLMKLEQIVIDNQNFKKKKIGLAVVMSTLVPGSGKIYAGAWKDGVLAFLYTGISAFQSYRGFDRRGVRSVLGWIFGSVSAGFYLGNIYGTGKFVKERKIRHQQNLIIRTKNVVKNSY